MERAQLESQMNEVKAEMREQLRALQSNHAHHHLPIDPRYDAHQLAHLRQVALQPPRPSQVPELPAQQPPQMESRAQAVELQQARSASSAISGLESAAPRAQPRVTAPEQGQSTASPPPPDETLPALSASSMGVVQDVGSISSKACNVPEVLEEPY